MTSRYELFTGRNNQYYFRLVAPNNEIILQSEGYVSVQGAENGIASCRLNSPYDANYQRLISTANQPYFTLKAANWQVIGVSQMYSSNQAMEVGISAVKRYGPGAILVRQAS
ncbi:YegP family protein [Pseudoalteromonas piscicida]|uniref:YegP family protein n=1 Tax=Pseudoalteromonas piscicida TaxID=43662 RepID=UPI0027E3FE08|nr:YegP family protein [Pseudoalteromonas piscicida]WMO15278.1 YegP family protein [Pseudoalteromonas piscicida]